MPSKVSATSSKVVKEKQPLLEIRKLKKYFDLGKKGILNLKPLQVRANDDVTFTIYNGETFGLVGESGCGKSTLGRVILQLYKPTSGGVEYFANDINKIDLSYVTNELKDLPKYQEDAIKYYQKSLEVDKKVEKLKKAITSIESNSELVDKSHTNKVKELESLENESKELKKNASRELREASRTVGALILEENIKEISELLLEAEKKLNNDSLVLQGLSGNYANMSKDVADIFKKVLSFKGKKTLEITERALEKDYQLKLDSNRETGINLSKLDPEEMRKLRSKLQIIFQDPYSSLDTRMTVGQIISEAVVEHGMYEANSPELEKYVLGVMDKCGLDAYMIHRYPHQFSGGQRQRIGIARALALKPEFVVADEAVSALDVSIRSQIINLLADLKVKEKLTYLFISHDLSIIKHVSDRIGVMYLGNMVELGTAEEIYKNPLHPYTKALLSAIPTTDEIQPKRIILKGDIPSNIFPPSGCKFRTRCPIATEKCAREVPAYEEVKKGHFVACHYYEKTKDIK